MKRISEEIVNKRFGRLVVKKQQWNRFPKKTTCLCLCDCGTFKKVQRSNILTGTSKSCGCLSKENISNRFLTHGMSKTRFYSIWSQMNGRCIDPGNKSFKRYGLRGIKVKWKTFEEFKNDMFIDYEKHCKKYSIKNTTIDRINNDGNYSKTNCRWATYQEQSANTSKNCFITYKNQTLHLSEWARKLNMNFYTFRHRIKTLNWSIKDAMTRKVR